MSHISVLESQYIYYINGKQYYYYISIYPVYPVV